MPLQVSWESGLGYFLIHCECQLSLHVDAIESCYRAYTAIYGNLFSRRASGDILEIFWSPPIIL